jgi:hypothetical protein
MKLKEETLYKYLEIILLESEITEPNSSMNILHEKYLNPITEEERNEYFSITDGIVSLGVKLGYFKYISKETEWYNLTEKGILAKSKGGHFKYVDFIERNELEKIKPTIIAENYIGGNNHGIQSSKKNSHNPINISTNPNPITELKANSIMLKFWKLISENKLISGLLIVIIFWVIKEKFGINLKF